MSAWVLIVAFSFSFAPAARAAQTPPKAVPKLSVWYDAADLATMTLTSAPNLVSQMNDKSGNGLALTQPAAPAQPAYTANAINGLAAVTFNGTSDFLYRTNGFPTASDYTVIYLGQFGSANTNNMISSYAGYANGVSHAFYGRAGYTPTLFDDTDWLVAPSVGTTPFFSVATYDRGTGFGSIYNNGTNAPTTGSGGAVTSDPSIEIGGFGGSGWYLTGMLGEALVYSRILTTAERQTIEGYLACKWGLQANLPSGHPYASACPAAAFKPTAITNLSVWYDASDSSTLSLTSSLVTQMSDKSGNGVTLAAPSAASPPALVSSEINGLPVLAFGGSQYLFATGGFPTNSDYTIACVVDFTGSSNNYILSSYAPSGTAHAFSGAAGTSPSIYQSGFVAGGPSTGSVPFVAVATSQTGTGDAAIYVNGGSASSGIAANSIVTDESLEIGGYAGAGGLSGYVGEILIYHAVLSTAERQFVEAYLACKWGLQASLPATHPYKTACPATATPSLALSLAVTPGGPIVSGAALAYTTSFVNSSGTLIYNPAIDSPVPAHTYFQVGSASASLAATGFAAAISYSADRGGTYAYTPASGAGGAPAGYDGNVTNVRWAFIGALGTAPSVNFGSVAFAVDVQ
jgi:hypothetical protein